MTDERGKECYGRSTDFQVCFRLPSIQFKSIVTAPDAAVIDQLAIATERRFFYLSEDWSVELSSTRYPSLSGVLTIPARVEDERFEFDGASVPLPWLVSLLTIGILRPLGVMLIASIIHDFAFHHGYLLRCEKSGKLTEVKLERADADALFRDIISQVNGNKVVGFIGWCAVRLGYWLGIPYNGKTFGGKPPWGTLLFSIVFFVCMATAITEGYGALLLGSVLCIYVSFYIVSLIKLKALKSNRA